MFFMLILRLKLNILLKYKKMLFNNNENFFGVKNIGEIYICII